MQISEAIYLAFDTILDDEVSVNEAASHIKTFIPEYQDIDIHLISRRVSSYLSRNLESDSPNYKKVKKGIYKRRKSFYR